MYSIGYKLVMDEVDRYRCRFVNLISKVEVVNGSFDPGSEFDAIIDADDSESVFRFLTILAISYNYVNDEVKRMLEFSLKDAGLL